MPKIILDLGFLKVSASYLQRRKSGRFYYYRRIPGDLRGHYGKSQFRVVSLKTTDEREALKKVAKLASQDDSYWTSLRTPAAQDMGLTTPEAREGAKALMARWGLSEGEGHRTGPDAHRQISEVVDVLDGYFIGRYGSDIAQTDSYVVSRREREKVEMLFAHLKRILRLDRLRLCGPNGARDEFHLDAAVPPPKRTADQGRVKGRVSIGQIRHPTAALQWPTLAHSGRRECPLPSRLISTADVDAC